MSFDRIHCKEIRKIGIFCNFSLINLYLLLDHVYLKGLMSKFIIIVYRHDLNIRNKMSFVIPYISQQQKMNLP
jgi:hypothetical protein